MDSDDILGMIVITIILFGLFMSPVIYSIKTKEIDILKMEAIQFNKARYNPTNGVFEWIKH